jgi:murein DD-endopeptidase MepM/ murein hydrolase activator NlpD
VDIYNWTRSPGEKKLSSGEDVPIGTRVKFYPPSQIVNSRERQLRPVYQYFTSLVSDSFAYITGDWCERGAGGGVPHYGVDVAAQQGTPILCPIEGIAICKTSVQGGHTVGVVKNGSVVFFMHMDAFKIKNGQTVKPGTVLGTVGMTGKTSGPHVHIGYGVIAPAADGIAFGKSRYKLTDPKLFFYREKFLANLD